MRRRLRGIFIGLCLALALVSAGLYVLGHWRVDSWSLAGQRKWYVELGGGRLTVQWERAVLTRYREGLSEEDLRDPTARFDDRSERIAWPPTQWEHHSRRLSPRGPQGPLGGLVEFRNGNQSVGSPAGLREWIDGSMLTFDRRRLKLPLAGMTLVFLLPVLAAALSRLAQRRYADGTCAGCGYDVRFGTGTCPECGLVAAGTQAVRVNALSPLLASVAIVLALGMLMSFAQDRGLIASFLFLPGEDVPDSDPKRLRRVPEVLIWNDGGSLVLAETHGRASYIHLNPESISREAAPPLTGLRSVEPSLQTIDDGGRAVYVLRLPIWLVLLVLVGGVALWIRSVHRRGGFRMGRIGEMPDAGGIPVPRGDGRR